MRKKLFKMHYKLQELPTTKHIKKIFFIGIKGVGMCPLAIISHQAGFLVAGSDLEEEFITDESLVKEDIQVFNGFEEFDIDLFFNDTKPDECLVVTTGAHGGFSNPQVKFAKEKGIVVLTQGQALAVMMEGDIFGREDIEGVAIAGAHGKTTISSMLSSALTLLKEDPTYSVGTGELFPIGAPGHYGKGKYFVVEADEYASEPVFDKIPKFLYLKPKFAIFNNIDFDHPDLFKDTESVFKAFVDFAHQIKSGGTLFINGDDKYLASINEKLHKDIKIRTYGENAENDYVISDIVQEGLRSEFIVSKAGRKIEQFGIEVPGEHNARNALAVIAFLLESGFSVEKIKETLLQWRGSKRRLELVGVTKKGVKVFDDYGHHPAEIETTIKALKRAYPDKKLVVIFQSHTYSRTKSLLSEFAESFKNADELVLLPIFASQRDTEQDILPKEAMINAFTSVLPRVKFQETFDDVVEYVGQNHQNRDEIVLTIGAGDVYKIANTLTKA